MILRYEISVEIEITSSNEDDQDMERMMKLDYIEAAIEKVGRCKEFIPWASNEEGK